MKKRFMKRGLGIFLAVVLTVILAPLQLVAASAEGTPPESSALLNDTISLGTGNSTENYSLSFEAGTAYSVVINWDGIPSFTGNYSGWRIETMSGQLVKDIILKTDKKNDTSSDTSIENFSGIFVTTSNATSLRLVVNGLAEAAEVSVQIDYANVASNVVLDATYSVASGTKYLNCYFDVGFSSNYAYNVTAEWNDTPTYTSSTTAWKIQATENENIDGNGTIIHRALRNTATNTSDKTYNGRFEPEEDLDVLNFFTQSVDEANQIHIRIERVDRFTSNIAVGNTTTVFDYQLEYGNAYLINVIWTDTPVFTGALKGWSLSSEDDNSEIDLIVKTAKKNSTSGNGNLSRSFIGVYIPTAEASALKLTSNGLVTANSVALYITQTSVDDDVLLDVTLSVENSTEYISAFFDMGFDIGNSYEVTAYWATPPAYTSANEEKTAWKVQAAQDRNVAGDDTVIYKTTASNGTAAQVFQGIYQCTAAKPVFNFFAQRMSSANQMRLIIKTDNTPDTPLSYVDDQVSVNSLFTASSSLNGHVMQGFDIFDDVVFVCYDQGYCATYDLNTGAKIDDFQLGSAYSSNHCGNVNFGKEYPAGNTGFPAMYVSGDLTTKACYVENITTTGSQLIQTIYFDILPSFTGGQVIIDRDRDRIMYMQRQKTNIRDIDNVFKIFEFRIPALSEGGAVHLGNDDVISSYNLAYYSPLYQGAAVYNGGLLQTHGYAQNGFGSYDGLMRFNIESHQFARHIDLSSIVAREPQGVTVYNDRLIVNFSGGVFYEISLELNIPQSEYSVGSAATESAFADNVKLSVEYYLPTGLAVAGVDITDMDENNNTFSADVTIQTPYNQQSISIEGSINTILP